jgi:hypothetical protein
MAATTIDPTPNSGSEPPAAKADTAAPAAEQAAPTAPPVVTKPRVLWRAVVRTGGQVAASRERDRVEWHLSICTAPQDADHHCTEGRHLIETLGHPDGHCIIDGVCGLCGAEAPRE